MLTVDTLALLWQRLALRVDRVCVALLVAAVVVALAALTWKRASMHIGSGTACKHRCRRGVTMEAAVRFRVRVRRVEADERVYRKRPSASVDQPESACIDQPFRLPENNPIARKVPSLPYQSVPSVPI